MTLAATPRPVLEEFEPRILYAADLAAVVQGVSGLVQAQDQCLQAAAATTTTAAHEIAFVDMALPDAPTLVAGLAAQREAGRAIEIVPIEAGSDGIEVIGATLAQRQGITALHLLAHGSDGEVQLGAVRLDGASLLARADELAPWSTALAADADLLIYGCDVAAGPAGQALLTGLAALTGADVAASTDLTGAAAQGGNWALEFRTGPIEASAAADAALQQAYAGTLAITTGGASSAASANNQTSLTFTHTVAAGANGLLVVEVMTGNATAVSAVTYGGVALSLLGGADSSGSEVRAEFWALTAPAAGTANVVVTASASTRIVAGATSFLGVDQAAPTGPVWTNKANDAAPTVAVPSAAGERVLDVAGALRVGSYTVGPGQTEVWSNQNGNGNGDVWAVSSTEPGAASVTMSHTFTSVGGASDKWVSLATTIRPANNAPPVITSDGGGASATRSVVENTSAVTTVSATDADGTAPTYRIVGGADAALFMIDAVTGALAFASAPDYETRADAGADNVYEVVVSADDGTHSDTQALSVTVTNVNEAPVIGSNGGAGTASVSVAENASFVTTVVATDPEAAAIAYSLLASPDRTKFAIDAVTGALRFIAAPDFENPADVGANNVYNVTVQVSDGVLSVTQALAVTVTDVGSPLTVTTTADVLDGNVGSIELLVANPGADGKISLREAISAANNGAGTVTLILPAGAYTITRAGAGEDLNALGDFDITSDIVFQGSGAASTVIDANGLDRAFDLLAGSAAFADLSIVNGAAGSQGGGLNVSTGTSATLDRVTVRNNLANNGAGIYNQGTATLIDVLIADNGYAGSGSGGGLNNRGTATLDRVTVANNTGARGAGIYSTGAALSIDNSTISGNVAGGVATGGGLYTNRVGILITNSTIANNSALYGGGLYSTAYDAISLGNTLLAGNDGGNNYYFSQHSLGYNLDTDGSAGLAGATDLNLVAANLGPLAANGGFAPTHALLAGSAAIDRGDPAAPAADQRGVARVGSPDIGAFESGFAANRAPVNALPGPQVLLEDVSRAIGGIAVADPDQGSGAALYELSKVAVAVSHGTLAVTLSGGAAIGAGANASASFTLTGSQADINATLASLRYLGDADYAGGDTLVVTSQDGAGLGDSDSLSLTVANVNDPPRGSDATLAVDKNGSRALLRADFGFADTAGEANAFASVRVQLPSAGTLRLNGTPLLAATEVGVAQLDAGALVFAPASGAAGAAYASLDFQVRDDGGSANGGVDLDPVQRTLSFDVVNRAPGITSLGGAASAGVAVAENTTAVTTASATDPDGDALSWSIAGGADAARFSIDAASGALRFVAAPSFEVRADSGADNVYDVTVQASDGSSIATQAIAVTVTDVYGAPGAASGMLWFTTAGSQTAAAGGATWSAGQLLQYGNAGDRFDIDGAATTGTIDVLAGFAAPVPVRGLHYVQSSLTIGTTGVKFTLDPGDLLMVLDPGQAPATVTLNAGDGNALNDFVAERRDIVVFRPATAGNYASGEYFMLLDNGVHDGATTYNVHALSLVEKDTVVGGVALPAGTFVVAHSDPLLHMNVYAFTATGTGAGAATQTSDAGVLVDGAVLGDAADQVQGLHLLTDPAAFDDTLLPAGSLLVAIKGSNTYAGVAQDGFDIVALDVTRTERNGGTVATGRLLFDGSDLGLNAGSANLNGFTVVTGAVTNSAPVNAIPLTDQTATQGLPFSLTVPAGAFTDADVGSPGTELEFAL